jgi:lipid-binding SYLF domain-containing protein
MPGMDCSRTFEYIVGAAGSCPAQQGDTTLKRLCIAVCLCAAVLLPVQGPAASDPAGAAKLRESLKTFTSFTAPSRTSIPPTLLQKATAVVIVPNMIKASFFVGARYGRGVLMMRAQDGRWSNPVLVSLGGGSFGLQMGLQSTDLVLVFRHGRFMDLGDRDSLLLGADVSVVAGNLSLHMDENTGTDPGAEIYSFSRSAGLTAGFSLQGAQLRLEDAATSALYGRTGLKAEDVLGKKIESVPVEVLRFREAFSKATAKTP